MNHIDVIPMDEVPASSSKHNELVLAVSQTFPGPAYPNKLVDTLLPKNPKIFKGVVFPTKLVNRTMADN